MVDKRYDYLLKQGWSQKDVEKYIGYLEEGKTPSQAYRYVKEGEPQESERVLWKGEKSDDIEIEDEEMLERKIPEKKDEYLKTRESIIQNLRKAKEVGKGIVDVGSRRPVKEAIISGAAKAVTFLKRKPKTPDEIREAKEEKKRLKEWRQKEEHVKRLSEAKFIGRRIPKPSLKDIGKGSMGAKRYEWGARDPVGYVGGMGSPDFFGKRARTRVKKTQYVLRPPSTSIGMGKLVNPVGETRPVKSKKSLKFKKSQQKDASEVLGLKGFW